MTETTRQLLRVLAIVAGIALGMVLVGVVLFYFINFRTYKSADTGVQMIYPSRWKVLEKPQPGAIVGFASPKEGAADTFIENVSLTETDLSKQPLNLREYADLARKQMTSVFSDVVADEPQSVRITGRDGYRLVFRGNADVPLVFVIYVYMSGDKAYNLTYAGMKDRFEKYDKYIVPLIASSLKVRY